MRTLGLEEAAAFLHLSKDVVSKMARSGEIPAAKLGPNSGREWIFTDESLEDYVRDEIARQTEKTRRSNGKSAAVSVPTEHTRAVRRSPRKPPPLPVA